MYVIDIIHLHEESIEFKTSDKKEFNKAKDLITESLKDPYIKITMSGKTAICYTDKIQYIHMYESEDDED